MESPFDQTPRRESEVTATRPTHTTVGSRVGGRFELLELIGRGGMAVVYRGRDLDLGVDVALKVLPPEAVRDPRERERLKREIVTARAVNHKNVIRIYEFGLAEEPFICMELLTGGTLAARLEKGPLPVPEVLRIGRGIAEGLAAAHAAGVIHRDVKPANVLFDSQGEPKLVDFGLARIADTTSSTIGFAGTPNYMSPEMADGRDLTVASDVYSFGVVLFEMLTGRLPFEASTLVRLVVLHTREKAPLPSQVRKGLPQAQWLDAVVKRCLEKDPARRFPDGQELASCLSILEKGGTPQIASLPPVRERRWFPSLLGGVAGALLAGGLVARSYLGHPAAGPTARASAVPSQTGLALVDSPPVVATPRVRSSAPAPAAIPTAVLSVTCKPWFEIWVDGKKMAEDRRWSGSLKPGHYHLRFWQPARNVDLTYEVDLKPGQRLELSVDGDARRVVPHG